jgi:site-specific recombinase XerD
MQEIRRFRPSTVSRRFSIAAGFYRTCRGGRMDRHAATRRLRQLAQQASITTTRPHPRMLRHTFVTTMLDAALAAPATRTAREAIVP